MKTVFKHPIADSLQNLSFSFPATVNWRQRKASKAAVESDIAAST